MRLNAALTWPLLGRILLKSLLLFVATNLLFALVYPLPALGRVSWHGWLIPARERLPYGENPTRANSLSAGALETLFGTHALLRPKPEDEYRLLLIGDSATWGFLLRPEETLSARLNARALYTPDGRRVRAYNLGYPTLSLTKDVLLLAEALRYQADGVLWIFSLESFPRATQSESAVVRNNQAAAARLGLMEAPPPLTLWERTLIGSRRPLAEWTRLQLYGLAYFSTGRDQDYPESYTPRQNNFEADLTWHSLTPAEGLRESALAWEVLQKGTERVQEAGAALWWVNAPIFVADGRNSDLRYNFFYPRWAYDAYREQLAAQGEAGEIALWDLWQAVPPAEFTDSPLHLTPRGVEIMATNLAGRLASALR